MVHSGPGMEEHKILVSQAAGRGTIAPVYFPLSLINWLISVSLSRRPPSLTAVPPHSRARALFVIILLALIEAVVSFQPTLSHFLVQVVFYSFNRDSLQSEAAQREPPTSRRFAANLLHLSGEPQWNGGPGGDLVPSMSGRVLHRDASGTFARICLSGFL